MAFLIPENLASSSKIPKAFRDVARAFRDMLDDSATVWLYESPEHLNEELADRTGTGSSGGRPCLVVLDPAVGVLLLHVVEGRRTGPKAKWRGLRRKIEKIELDEFACRLDQFAEKITARLEQLRRGSRGNDRASGSAAAPTAVTSAVLLSATRADVAEADRYLLKEDFAESRLHEALARIVALESASEGESWGEVDENLARGAIHPSLIIRREDAPAQGRLFRPPEHGGGSIAVLDRDQERLARGMGPGYRVVKGVAGSGKTLVLKCRAEHLARHFPQHRILLTCFNRLLADALENELSEHPGVHVATVDSLASRVCWSAGANIEGVGDEVFGKRRAAAIEALTSGVIDAEDLYHCVLVDEVQDLDNAGLQLAHGMLRPGCNDFVVAADAAQRVYRRGLISWTPPGTSGRGRTTLLKLSYRSTREILRLAYDFLTDGEFDQADSDWEDLNSVVHPEAAARSGERPQVKTFGSAREALEAICGGLSAANKAGTAWSDMCVMIGNWELRQQMREMAGDYGIPFTDVADRSYFFNGQALGSVVDKVCISTLQKVKGLEYRRVYIAGVNDISAGPDADDETRRRLLYVGMTRATDYLRVAVHGDGPIVDSLNAASARF